MREIYKVNYCNPNCSPLRSITRLSKGIACEMAKDMADRYKGTSFHRFRDFKRYYPERLRTEKWLYEWFINNGGEPENEHPLYFVLDGSDYLEEWFEKGEVTRLPIRDICPGHISFTFGDSMAKFLRPERKDPFLKEDLLEMIGQYDYDIKLFLNSIRDDYTYIEAQLWSDIYIR